MSPALVHGIVDRWLSTRTAWINRSAERLALVNSWREIAVEFGAGHPAALGCLLALVREAWNDPCIYARKSDTRGEWVVWRKLRHDDEAKVSEAATEAEALVDALEAAP